MKNFKKVIALLLSLVMILSCVPNMAYAKTNITSLDWAESEGNYTLHANNGDIDVTYGDYGYNTFLKFDTKEFSFGEEGTGHYNQMQSNKYSFTNDSCDFTVSFEKQGANTVLIHYTLKNKLGEEKAFKIADTCDIELGDNDNAAIGKTGSDSFLITQDDYNHDFSYGAQVGIKLDPTPTTRWIGDYEENDDIYYYTFRYNESTVNTYTKRDELDTALCYSWQGNIAAGESKTFTAIYNMQVAKDVTLNFYKKFEDGYISKPETVVTMAGSEFVVPYMDYTEYENNKFNRWYNEDKTQSYLPGTVMLAPMVDTDFYQNSVEPLDTDEKKYQILVVNDNLSFESRIDSSALKSEGETITITPSYYGDINEDEKIDSFILYPGGEKITAVGGTFTFTMPACDVALLPKPGLTNLYIDTKYNNEDSLPTISSTQLEFETSWVDENNNPVTKLEDNKEYYGSFVIEKTDDIDLTTVKSISFDEVLYGIAKLGVSNYAFSDQNDLLINNTLGDKDTDVGAMIDNKQGAYIDSDGNLHVMFKYMHIDNINITINNLSIGGNSDASDVTLSVDDELIKGLKDVGCIVNSSEDVIKSGDSGMVMVFMQQNIVTNPTRILDIGNANIKLTNSVGASVENYRQTNEDLIRFILTEDGNEYNYYNTWATKAGAGLCYLGLVDFYQSSGSSKKYKAKDTLDTGDKISGTGKKGSTRTITTDTNKKLVSIIVKDKDGNIIDLTDNEDGTYSFKQPASDVTVEIKYEEPTKEEKLIEELMKDDVKRADSNEGKVIDPDAKFINGYEDGTFLPNRTVSNIELMSMVTELFTDAVKGNGEALNLNQGDNAWADEIIKAANKLGLVPGDKNDPNYNLADEVTRADLAVVIYDLIKDYTESSSLVDSCLDAKGKSYEKAVAKLVELGVLKGYDDGLFHGENTLTRAEAVVVINRALRSLGFEITTPSITKSFPDLTPSHWAYYEIMFAANK